MRRCANAFFPPLLSAVVTLVGAQRGWDGELCDDVVAKMRENVVFRVEDMLDCWDGMLTFQRVGVVLAIRKFLEQEFPEEGQCLLRVLFAHPRPSLLTPFGGLLAQ